MPERSWRFRRGSSPLEQVETGHLTRLGLEPAPQTLRWQDHLNNNMMAEDCLRILTCRYRDGLAWVLTVELNCRHAFSPGEAELERWLDEIVYAANETQTPCFIPIDLVTFTDDPEDPSPVRDRQPRQAAALREWLIEEYSFTSFGTTPNGRGELIGVDPAQEPDISYAGVRCAAELREFFEELERRFENGADRVWAIRQERKLVLALKGSRTDTVARTIPYDVACPKCGALAGQRCHNPDYPDKFYIHRARWQAAKR